MTVAAAVDDWLDASPEVHQSELVRADIDVNMTRAQETANDLRHIEDRLLERSVDVIDGAMRFADLTKADLEDESADPPAAWVKELGMDRAQRVYTAAKQGWQNAKSAPVGIKVAEGVAKSIIKARSMERAAPTTLAIAIINQTNNYEYNEAEVEID